MGIGGILSSKHNKSAKSFKKGVTRGQTKGKKKIASPHTGPRASPHIKKKHPHPPKPGLKAGNVKKQKLSARDLRKKAALEAETLRLAEQKLIDAEMEKKRFEQLSSLLTSAYARQLIIDLAGENSLEMVRHFRGGMSDEEISRDLKLKISDVRAALNRLHNEGIVFYCREKDNETGWYSYTWRLNQERLEKWVNTKMLECRVKVGQEGLDEYFCDSCGIASIIGFEVASERSFKCVQCSRNLDFLDEEAKEELFAINKRRL